MAMPGRRGTHLINEWEKLADKDRKISAIMKITYMICDSERLEKLLTAWLANLRLNTTFPDVMKKSPSVTFNS